MSRKANRSKKQTEKKNSTRPKGEAKQIAATSLESDQLSACSQGKFRLTFGLFFYA